MKGGTVRVAKGKSYRGPQQGGRGFGTVSQGGWQGNAGMGKKSILSTIKKQDKDKGASAA